VLGGVINPESRPLRGDYERFVRRVQKLVPESRVFTDRPRRLAYSSDASFYRLVPQVVVKVRDEEEVRRVLPLAKSCGTPVTFRR